MGGAGDLDKRIRFERLVSSQDDAGSMVKDWVYFCTVWAGLFEQSGSEVFNRADEKAATKTVIFKIRSSSVTRAVTPIDRIFYNSGFYEIIDLIDLGRNNFIKITAMVRDDWTGNL